MPLESFAARHVANPAAERGAYDDRLRSILGRPAFLAARDEITTWTGYRPTPLVALPGLAKALRLARLDAKSHVVAIVSEGATDPATYARVVGRSAEAVTGD
jgi:hypothetical protein